MIETRELEGYLFRIRPYNYCDQLVYQICAWTPNNKAKICLIPTAFYNDNNYIKDAIESEDHWYSKVFEIKETDIGFYYGVLPTHLTHKKNHTAIKFPKLEVSQMKTPFIKDGKLIIDYKQYRWINETTT